MTHYKYKRPHLLGWMMIVGTVAAPLACQAAPDASAQTKSAPPSDRYAEVGDQSSEQAAPALSGAALVDKGRQLVQLGGCQDCHTPMAFDPNRGMPVPQAHLAFSGHPKGAAAPSAKPGPGDQAVIGGSFTSFTTPFGVVFAANITPDPETGIGTWSEQDFIQTVRSGRHKGTGRVVLPPMPMQNLAALKDEELRAMFAFLMAQPAIKNPVPEPQVAPAALEAISKSLTMVSSQEH